MALSTKNNLFPNIEQNQFSITPARGMVALGSTPNIMSVSLDPKDTEEYFVGDFVTINTDSLIKKGIIVKKADPNSGALGMILYNPKTSVFSNARNSSTFEIAFPSSTLYAEVSEAVQRGSRLSVDISDPDGIMRLKLADSTTTIAIALEPADNEGDIVMVEFIF